MLPHVGTPESVSLTFSTSDSILICASTGGPATNVTWKKNGIALDIDRTNLQQSQVITDMHTSEYHTMLKLPTDNITYFSGKYECIVENGRGSNNASTTLEGTRYSASKA